MKNNALSALTTAAVLLVSGVAYAHCEIPCGIYADKVRVVMLYEHATKVQQIVTQYFMTQRIKPPADGDGAAQKKYTIELGCLHRMLISAMKCKQTLDAANVASLRKELDAFAASYFNKEDLEHIQKHHKGGK